MPSDLFRAFPIAGTRSTSLGPQPVPYHVYDGEVVLLGGSVEAGAARGLLAGQNLDLLLDPNGRALACVWICDFTQASLGPHSELQLSLAVTRRDDPLSSAAGTPVGKGPFELLRLLLVEPGLRLYSAVLWNDLPLAVAYNRELLALNARLCQASISRGEAGGSLSFRFEDLDQRLICQGDVLPPLSQPFWDGLLLERALGSLGMRRTAAYPWLSAQVMAPGIQFSSAPCESQTYLQAGSTVLARFSSADAHLDFGPAFPAGLDFRPAFLEHFTGFQFVYLPPYNLGDVQNGTSIA
jgi:hypothetical protein